MHSACSAGQTSCRPHLALGETLAAAIVGGLPALQQLQQGDATVQRRADRHSCGLRPSYQGQSGSNRDTRGVEVPSSRLGAAASARTVYRGLTVGRQPAAGGDRRRRARLDAAQTSVHVRTLPNKLILLSEGEYAPRSRATREAIGPGRRPLARRSPVPRGRQHHPGAHRLRNQEDPLHRARARPPPPSPRRSRHRRTLHQIIVVPANALPALLMPAAGLVGRERRTDPVVTPSGYRTEPETCSRALTAPRSLLIDASGIDAGTPARAGARSRQGDRDQRDRRTRPCRGQVDRGHALARRGVRLRHERTRARAGVANRQATQCPGRRAALINRQLRAVLLLESPSVSHRRWRHTSATSSRPTPPPLNTDSSAASTITAGSSATNSPSPPYPGGTRIRFLRSVPENRAPKNERPPPPRIVQRKATMSQAEDTRHLTRKADAGRVSVEDVRQLIGSATPRFALRLRSRIANLIADLPEDDPAHVDGEREIARLKALGFAGENRREAGERVRAPAGLAGLPEQTPAPEARRAPQRFAADTRSRRASRNRRAGTVQEREHAPSTASIATFSRGGTVVTAASRAPR